MKVVILAGGLGTRLSEETESRPKPLVEIGGKPIIWHIMKRFARYGHKEFVIAAGYKGEQIKRFFADYHLLNGNMTVRTKEGIVSSWVTDGSRDDWKVTIIDTGLNTQTGGRVSRLQPFLNGESFFLTYGDGVADVDLDELLEYHETGGWDATITAVRPQARFGEIRIDDEGTVRSFKEKSQLEQGWINGGFMVVDTPVFDLINDDSDSFETEVLTVLAKDGRLGAYKHTGFWQCMDTLREKNVLEGMFSTGNTPWLPQD